MSKNRFLGGTWPVVQRELREGARRPFNYWLRVAAATAGLLMVVYIINENRDEEDKVMGQYLFAGLHVVLMGLICLVVPLMTADCIAREKREGTLGLLFLTPLTAGGIVAGKAMAQGLRALTLWVSMVPVLAIPFVMGGIGWADASAFLALEFSALVLSLAAGLLASTLVKGRGAAFVVALLLGTCMVSVFCQSACMCFLAQFQPSRGLLGPFFPFDYHMLLYGLPLDTLPGVTARGSTASQIWHQILWITPIPALLLFVLVLRFAAWRMARSWRDKTPSLRQESLIRKYCTPLFQRWSARRTRRTLGRNPIAWLQQYSWRARLIKWVLCLAFVVVVTATVSGDLDMSEITEPLLGLTLAAGMTFAGINSFAEEKRSGALELILITPISINQIIFGRVLGVWKQFLPAALIFLGFDAGIHWIRGDLRFNQPGGDVFFQTPFDYIAGLLAGICGFLSLPVFALYFALRLKNQIVAAVMSWVAMLLPVLFMVLFIRALRFQLVIHDPEDITDFSMSVAFALGNLALALVACFLLRHCLSRRLYSF